ncbi:MAG: NAD(P)-dependent oxidoreductase [Myxococcales bacterium]
MAPDRLAPPATVAFVGLGKMGFPMAARLVAAGWQVRAFDASPPARDAFAAAHPRAVRAGSPADAAKGAQLAVTMLPDGKVVRQVVLDQGLAEGLPRGAAVVDMSSSSPMDTQALGKDLAARGVGLIDAPVSGGVKRAQEGKLAIMAGGDPALADRCQGVLAALGTVSHVGTLGCGHALKALNNFVSACGLVAACEAMVIGKRFGLDPAVMIDVINTSTGRNNSTELKAKQFILSGTFASGFSLGLMAKDLGTAAEIADHLRVGAPMSHAARDLWAKAKGSLGQDADHTEIYRYVEGLDG